MKTVKIEIVIRMSYDSYGNLIVNNKRQNFAHFNYAEQNRTEFSELCRWAESLQASFFIGRNLIESKQTRQKVIKVRHNVIDVLLTIEVGFALVNRIVHVHTPTGFEALIDHRAKNFNGWIVDSKEYTKPSQYLDSLLESARIHTTFSHASNVIHDDITSATMEIL